MVVELLSVHGAEFSKDFFRVVGLAFVLGNHVELEAARFGDKQELVRGFRPE